MLLSARMLTGVCSINIFEYTQSVEWTLGDTVTVYLQLIDASLDKAIRGFSPAGRRYCPAAGSTLNVQINSIDSLKTFTKVATQPYPTLDASIWSFTVAASDGIVGSRDLLLVLNEAGVVRNGRVNSAISVTNTVASF